jgi:S1-C subfamily serine protease
MERNVGTAFAVSPDHLVTAAHVCDIETKGPVPIEINNINPEFIFVWRESDLCLLRVDDHGVKPLPVRWHPVKFGEHVWIFGSPLGISNILTTGYASDEVTLELGDYSGDRLKLAAHAYPGNSGGPVIDDQGRVIGVLVAGTPAYTQISYAATLRSLQLLLREGLRR